MQLKFLQTGRSYGAGPGELLRGGALVESVPGAAKHVAHFMAHQFFHRVPGRRQVLARVKFFRIFAQDLTQRGCHRQAQVGIDVDLGATDSPGDFNV